MPEPALRFTFPGRCKIIKAASPEASRYSFQFGRYRRGYVEASTGRVLARIPVDLEDKDAPGKEFYLPQEALVVLSKGSHQKIVEIDKGYKQISIQDSGTQAVSIFPIETEGTKFPHTDELLAGSHEPPTFSVCLNVRYLLDLAQALDAEALRFCVWSNVKPVRVEPLGIGDGYGIGLIEQQEDEPVRKRGVGTSILMPVVDPEPRKIPAHEDPTDDSTVDDLLA